MTRFQVFLYRYLFYVICFWNIWITKFEKEDVALTFIHHSRETLKMKNSLTITIHEPNKPERWMLIVDRTYFVSLGQVAHNNSAHALIYDFYIRPNPFTIFYRCTCIVFILCFSQIGSINICSDIQINTRIQ